MELLRSRLGSGCLVAGVRVVGQACCAAGGAGGDEQVVALRTPVPLAGLAVRGCGLLGLVGLLPHRPPCGGAPPAGPVPGVLKMRGLHMPQRLYDHRTAPRRPAYGVARDGGGGG